MDVCIITESVFNDVEKITHKFVFIPFASLTLKFGEKINSLVDRFSVRFNENSEVAYFIGVGEDKAPCICGKNILLVYTSNAVKCENVKSASNRSRNDDELWCAHP